MEKDHERPKKENWIIMILIVLFLHNTYKFINTQGSDHQLLEPLFKMIIILAILLFLFNKKKLIGNHREIIGQTHLEKYFKRKKKD